MDILRQLLCIAAVLLAVLAGKPLGFAGMLTVMALAELAGMGFMLAALKRVAREFNLAGLARDGLRLTLLSAAVLLTGWLAAHLAEGGMAATRWHAAAQLAIAAAACGVALLPALHVSQLFSRAERQALQDVLLRRRQTVPAQA